MIGTLEVLVIVAMVAVLALVGGKGELELFLVRFLAWLLSRPVDGGELPRE